MRRLHSAVFLIGASVAAQAAGLDYYRVTGVTEGGVLNLRERPDVESPAVASVPGDARWMLGLGCVGGPDPVQWAAMSEAEREAADPDRWCKVHYRGLFGWAAAWHLMPDTAP